MSRLHRAPIEPQLSKSDGLELNPFIRSLRHEALDPGRATASLNLEELNEALGNWA